MCIYTLCVCVCVCLCVSVCLFIYTCTMLYLYYAVRVIAEYFSPLLPVCLAMRSSHQVRDLGEEEREEEEEATLRAIEREAMGMQEVLAMLLETVVAHHIHHDGRVRQSLIMESHSHQGSPPSAPLVSSPPSMWETHPHLRFLATFLMLKFFSYCVKTQTKMLTKI